VFLDLMKSIYI